MPSLVYPPNGGSAQERPPIFTLTPPHRYQASASANNIIMEDLTSRITPAPLTHDQILNRLRGQTLRVPDLTALFKHWPGPTVNPHVESVRSTVQEAIDQISTIRPSAARRQSDDIATLTSLWFPLATEAELKTLALYAVWLICWDDEVDSDEGALAGDFQKAEEWRKETQQVLDKFLDLLSSETAAVGSDPLHDVLATVGEDLQQHCEPRDRRHIRNEVAIFIRKCAVEQAVRLKGIVPNFSSYMDMRIGTVAGGTLCSLINFSHSKTTMLPDGIANFCERLYHEVNVLLSLMNDLLSLKKELRTGTVINAVATLMTEDNDLDSVVAEIIAKMKESVKSFDRDAGFLQRARLPDDLKTPIKRCIDGCRSIVTGTLVFTWVFSSVLIYYEQDNVHWADDTAGSLHLGTTSIACSRRIGRSPSSSKYLCIALERVSRRLLAQRKGLVIRHWVQDGQLRGYELTCFPAASRSVIVPILYPLFLNSGSTILNIGGVHPLLSWQMMIAPGCAILKMCRALTP